MCVLQTYFRATVTLCPNVGADSIKHFVPPCNYSGSSLLHCSKPWDFYMDMPLSRFFSFEVENDARIKVILKQFLYVHHHHHHHHHQHSPKVIMIATFEVKTPTFCNCFFVLSIAGPFFYVRKLSNLNFNWRGTSKHLFFKNLVFRAFLFFCSFNCIRNKTRKHTIKELYLLNRNKSEQIRNKLVR